MRTHVKTIGQHHIYFVITDEFGKEFTIMLTGPQAMSIAEMFTKACLHNIKGTEYEQVFSFDNEGNDTN